MEMDSKQQDEENSTKQDLPDTLGPAAATEKTVLIEREHKVVLAYNGWKRAFDHGKVLYQGEGDGSSEPAPLSSSPDSPDRLPKGVAPNPPNSELARKVELYRGNLVLDCRVPPMLLRESYPASREEVTAMGRLANDATSHNEFTHTRYSAVTCQPVEFVSSRYTLRPKLFAPPRQTDIFVAVTYYNEDDVLLGRTLRALLANVQQLCRDDRWGRHGWKRVVICLIADGRHKIHPRALALMSSLGVYAPNQLKSSVNNERVVSHVFEYTTRATIEERRSHGGLSIEVQPGAADAIPCQMILCLKDQSERKINSHSWAINAFCAVLDPYICFLVEAGTIPSDDALFNMRQALQNDAATGAAIAPVSIYTESASQFFNPLVGFQNFEYTTCNNLMRPFEASTGLRTSINQGGFVGYLYDSISTMIDNKSSRELLHGYFTAPLRSNLSIMSLLEANRYLVEDRVIAWKMLCQENHGWKMTTVEGASVQTDAPETLTDMLFQRRRWINGAKLNSAYELLHMYRINWRRMGFGSQIGLLAGFLHSAAQFIMEELLLGNAFILSFIVVRSLTDEFLLGATGERLTAAFAYLYALFLAASFALGLSISPRGGGPLYKVMMISWAALFTFVVCVLIYEIARFSAFEGTAAAKISSQVFTLCVWPIVSKLILWTVAPMTLLRMPSHLIWLPHYLLTFPGYLNLVTTYARCNLHDVTWGAKASSVAAPLRRTVQVEYVTDKSGTAFLPHADPSAEDLDLDKGYSEARQLLQSERAPDNREASEDQRIDDQFRAVRTVLLLLWLSCNTALMMVILNVPSISMFRPANGGEGFWYFGVVLWIYVALDAIQYLGTIALQVRRVILLFSRVLQGS